MAGFDPAIYAAATERSDAARGVDHRVKPGDDDFRWQQPTRLQLDLMNRTAVGQARP
jgi:hypothetical protein